MAGVTIPRVQGDVCEVLHVLRHQSVRSSCVVFRSLQLVLLVHIKRPHVRAIK
jgi:hypothetical protein